MFMNIEKFLMKNKTDNYIEEHLITIIIIITKIKVIDIIIKIGEMRVLIHIID